MSQEHDREVQSLQGGLKALITRLTEAELLLVHRWVKNEIEVARNKPALRIVRPPSQDMLQREMWEQRSFTEVAGDVRRLVHELPEPSLVALHGWVREQLDLHYGYRR